MFPTVRASARPPLAPLMILLACLLLAGLLTLISWRNYQHEEKLRQRLLQQQGLTLIRTFEAGARTGMMMRWREDSLQTLVAETVRDTDVAYIVIVDPQGSIRAAAGSWSKGMSLPLARALRAKSPLTRMTSDSKGEPVYEVFRRFRSRGGRPHPEMSMMRMMSPGERKKHEHDEVGAQAIFVGLYTGEFRQARLDSLRQNLLLGGLLLLVGTAGFYLLFLAQRNRVARSTLETMELYNASLIEGMPAGLLSLDAERRILAVNAQTLEMLGYRREDLLGRNLADLVQDEAFTKKLAEERDFIEQSFCWHTADEKPLPLRISASRLMSHVGELLGTVLILRDMRELQAMEEQLERSRRHSALGVMATGVAHEIRNPLGTLRGFAQYFQRSSEDSQAQEYASLMIREVDRLNRVISALLQFSRPSEVELAPVDSSHLGERIRILMADEAKARDIELKIDCHDAPEFFQGDFDLLLQMLLNLLQNAVEATDAGGWVTLKISRQKTGVEIRVSDNGRGIKPEVRRSIFDPFFTTRKSGTGLGLAIVSQIVAQHSGKIALEPVTPQGTEFIIFLPQENGQNNDS